MKLKYLSLFSGIGGFELGIGNKAKCIGFSEIDKYAIQVYKKQFNHKNYGDITKINVQELPDFDLIVGGFPCQSFSIAGKRGGFKDTRGTLFFNIAEIARVKKPRLLLLENVKGLLSHNEGNTFATIISTLDELGYDCQWQVLNSKNFGVPQNRERVFIIGHLRGTSRPKVFPIGESNEESINKTDKQGIANTLTGRSASGHNRRGNYIKTKEVINPLKGKTKYGWHCEQNIYDKKGITRTVKAGGGSGNMPKVIVKIPSATKCGYEIAKEGDSIRLAHIGSKTGRGRVGKQRSQTLTAGGDMHTLHNSKIRRLTPKECERLQGFPDDWTEYGMADVISYGKKVAKEIVPISDTQRYKMAGNAVSVPVIKAIVKRLIV